MRGEVRQQVMDAMIAARGFIAGSLYDRGPIPESLAAIVRNLDRAIGALLPASSTHDAGAWARCSWCGRYSASPRALGSRRWACDCGRDDGWSGSFRSPGPDAQWSLGFPVRAAPGKDGAR